MTDVAGRIALYRVLRDERDILHGSTRTCLPPTVEVALASLIYAEMERVGRMMTEDEKKVVWRETTFDKETR